MPIGWLEILLIALVGLALFGPKALQSLARNAGKGVAQMGQIKNKVIDDLAVDDLRGMASSINTIRNPRKAMTALLLSENEEQQNVKEKKQTASTSEQTTPPSSSSSVQKPE